MVAWSIHRGCVSVGPLRNRRQDKIRQARDLFGETLVKDKRER